VTGQHLPRSVRLSDPRALRAYAHPTRMALVALLRRDGPHTATQAAKAIGESVASCSFHLRQMAKYGLVEEAGRHGREKPWRATAMFTDFDVDGGDPAAGQALALAMAGQYFEVMTRWVRASSGEPAEWREAAQLGDTTLHLTADELRDLGDKMQRLLEPYLERLGEPVPHPAGARPVVVLNMTFPILTSPIMTSTEEDR
jgi:DNA-binding transcriptional ArsR family regulator